MDSKPTTPLEALLREYMAAQQKQHEQNLEQMSLMVAILQKMEAKVQPPPSLLRPRLDFNRGPFIAEASAVSARMADATLDVLMPKPSAMAPSKVAERINKAWRQPE